MASAVRASMDAIWPVIRASIQQQHGDDNQARIARNIVHALRRAGFDIVIAEDAAPDLLSALKRAVTILERLDTIRHLDASFPALDAARAAIAKAGGVSV